MSRCLFISFSDADRVHAENLAALLRRAGLPVECSVLDERDLAVSNFWRELDRTILRCEVLVTLCSARSSSPVALAELGVALARAEREPRFPIIPALLGQGALDDLPAPLRSHQYIVLPEDLLDASDAEREEILRQFRGLIRVKQEPSTDAAWQRAAERVAAHLRYGGRLLRPQEGLVPLGRDPDSHLEEFWVRGTGAPLERASNGRLQVREDSAVVLVLMPAGEFEMGASDADLESRVALSEECPRRAIQLAPYFIAKSPLTQLQFACAMGRNRSRTSGPTLPVSDVTFAEAQQWCARAGLQLPSEAQWEYACRAGSTLRYTCGDREEDLARCGWYAGNTRGPQPVGLLAPNRFGLHDMHGLVWEWCADGWRPNHLDASRDGAQVSPPTAGLAVARGGCWAGPALFARSAHRRAFGVDEALDTLGLRPARAVLD